jgi:hypothetical protein
MATKYPIQAKPSNFRKMGPNVTETLNAVVEAELPSAPECVTQVDRMVCSPLFLGSEALCKLLKYLAHHTLNTPADHLKEYQIATQVFGRAPDFDPQLDSCVRVQMGRLRAKLTQYYDTEGASDAILVEVPKGRYVLSFERRAAVLDLHPTPLPSYVEPVISVPSFPLESSRSRRWILPALAALAAVVAVALIGLFHGSANYLDASRGRSAPAVFRTFWSPFLQGRDEPFVVFANANFVGNAETGMRYFEPGRDSDDQISQHYTGVGEVVGVLELDRLFAKFGSKFRIKRGGLFTLDDARNNNLIFVGSPMENLTLDQIPGTREFVFRRLPAGPNHWREAIVDLHPPKGEDGVYPSAQTAGQENVDYAVVALMHGLDAARWTLILAGTSTIGTQAAVDYVCDESSLQKLLYRLNISNTSDLKPFEALLRVKVANDVPLETNLSILRRTDK